MTLFFLEEKEFLTTEGSQNVSRRMQQTTVGKGEGRVHPFLGLRKERIL
jgi:hypothetical protein